MSLKETEIDEDNKIISFEEMAKTKGEAEPIFSFILLFIIYLMNLIK